MTDFLAKLAARTLGLTPVVQPRLSSLFEPPRGANGLGHGESAHPETVDHPPVSIEPSPKTALPAPLFISPLPDLLPASLPTPTLSAVRAPEEAHSAHSASGVVPPVVVPASPPRPPPPPGLSPTEMSGPPADGETASRARHLEQPLPPAGRSPQDSVPQQSRRVPALTRRNPRQPGGSGERPAIRSSSATGRHELRGAPRESSFEPGTLLSDASRSAMPLPPEPAAAPSAVEPPRTASLLPRDLPLRAMPLLRPRATPDLGREAESKSPADIHVTIGRVEVRATTNPGRTDRAPAAAPVLGLDEYLRRRSSGDPR